MAGLKEHIFLIGFMGCGKSTNAECLAEMTGARQVEMDQMIVENEGMAKYKPSFANRNDSFLEILVSKPILSIPYDLTPLFNNAITSFSCIIEHLCLS